jgi:phosphoribosyl-AMP cyclohydrolase
MNPIDEIDFEKGGGLVTAIAQDDATGDILMVAYMNEESFRKTLELGEVVYFSRSRQQLWHKGESSGNIQRVKSISIDCDGDAVLLRIDQRGNAACHTGKRSCFFRRLDDGTWVDEGEQIFDPDEVYSK